MGVERARLLTDNIELDQRAQQLIEHTAEATSRVDLLTAQETGGREALAALDEALEDLCASTPRPRRNSARTSNWNWSANNPS